MKRILILLLTTSPCFILATPEYEVTVFFLRNFGKQEVRTPELPLNKDIVYNFRSNTHEYKYTLNIKLLSVLNKKANLEYLINRQEPNPTSHKAYRAIEVDTDSRQEIPCLLDNDTAQLYVLVKSTPTEPSSCSIL